MAASTRSDPYLNLRREIDRIDAELLRLLNERAAAALEIGRLKRARNEPIHVPEREQAVLEALVRQNGGPLAAEDVTAVFRAVIATTRGLEEREAGL